MTGKLVVSNDIKTFTSENYNFFMNKHTGLFARWGKTQYDNPDFSPIGPEIADIEITTKCDGVNGQVCKFCYKSNTPNGVNMSLDTFKAVFHKLPQTLTQIAFGADSHATSNPDLFAMMDYCRNNDYNQVAPNITVAQITPETADNLMKYVGAVAVSRYNDKNVCYDSVKLLTDRGLTQCNIHIMVSEESFENVMETMNDRLTDPRLSKLNAIVLLSLKQKGRGVHFNPLSFDKFKEIVDFAMDNGIAIGFDSCSACKFLASVKDRPNFAELEIMAEPCESGLFSIYINTEGKVFPCSFSEEIEDWQDGIDVASCNDFLKDIWFGERISKWRKGLLANKRGCPVYLI